MPLVAFLIIVGFVLLAVGIYIMIMNGAYENFEPLLAPLGVACWFAVIVILLNTASLIAKCSAPSAGSYDVWNCTKYDDVYIVSTPEETDDIHQRVYLLPVAKTREITGEAKNLRVWVSGRGNNKQIFYCLTYPSKIPKVDGTFFPPLAEKEK